VRPGTLGVGPARGPFAKESLDEKAYSDHRCCRSFDCVGAGCYLGYRCSQEQGEKYRKRAAVRKATANEGTATGEKGSAMPSASGAATNQAWDETYKTDKAQEQQLKAGGKS
jgi:hypothetical protein